MKFLILALQLILVFHAHAAEVSAHDVRTAIKLEAQTFVMNGDGLRVLAYDSGYGTFGLSSTSNKIESVYMASPAGQPKVFLDFSLKINDDKTMEMSITQYSNAEWISTTNELKKTGKVRSESYPISFLSSVQWKMQGNGDTLLVTRFNIQLVPPDDIMKMNYTPFSLTDFVMWDNAKRVWSAGGSVTGGEVVRISTPQGTIYLSFSEFTGSREMGVAKENLVTIQVTDKISLRIRSSTPVLGAGYAGKVYGVYQPKRTITGGGVAAMRASDLVKDLK